MKKVILLSALFLIGSAMANAQCVKKLQLSTGYWQTPGMLITDGTADDDWLLTQMPTGTSGSIGSAGTIITKYPGYDWAGSGTTAKYMNYHNSGGGPNNWYNNTLPIVYQNGFCVCPSSSEAVQMTLTLDLHCDNWSEVWLLDAAGNPVAGVPQPLLTQTHQHITGNFRDPEDHVSIPLMLPTGTSYSLALLQRNKTSVTGVSLDAVLSMTTPGLMYGTDCNFVPSLPGTFQGSTVTAAPTGGGGSGGGGGVGSGGCNALLNASTGYDQGVSVLLPDNQPDADWILTQVPVGTSTSNVGLPGLVVPKPSFYDWAGTTSKYINFQNGLAGPTNWYNNELPIIYQNGFCICGSGGAVPVTFELELHCDAWSEVWLFDATGNPIAMLLSQTHISSALNYTDPEDMMIVTHQLIPGQYSLALLQRNYNGPTAVSLEAIIKCPSNGVMNGQFCSWIPAQTGPFFGSPVTPAPGGGGNKTQGAINTVDENSTVSVYPNPATNSFQLEGFSAAVHVVLTDLQGKVVMNQTVDNGNSVDVTNLASGTYLLNATDKDGHELTQRLIIE